ncbi:concanavalin A-like lectin/glucanase domain-containing protein [Kalaharituber pfeilii]|nr:concanavalin A-like lectin/glucanase domain-containing protein [Kalaharituber pfeilii]
MNTKGIIIASTGGWNVCLPAILIRNYSSEFCGQWDLVQTSNNYIIYNNLWGMGSATSGSQCTTLISTSGTSVSWRTRWNWAGGQYNVKSFANANLVFTPKRVSAITSMPSTVRFSYTGTGMVANVAYDIFTSSTSGGTAEFEIMIWLASYGGAGPISSTGSPIATGISLAGNTWNLYQGAHSGMTVYSFVATSNGGIVSNFSGDTKLFLTYLANNRSFPTSQFVNTVQCGTEPFLGSNAVFTVSSFSVSVN